MTDALLGEMKRWQQHAERAQNLWQRVERKWTPQRLGAGVVGRIYRLMPEFVVGFAEAFKADGRAVNEGDVSGVRGVSRASSAGGGAGNRRGSVAVAVLGAASSRRASAVSSTALGAPSMGGSVLSPLHRKVMSMFHQEESWQVKPP